METEHLIQRALAKLMEGRTSFVIAHRLRTARLADEIIVLERGRIVQQGTHDQLVAQDGFYKELYELQSEDEALAAATPTRVEEGQPQ